MDIGALNVRRAAFMQATPQTVWQQFETFEKLAAWFGHGHELLTFDAKLGGTVRLSVQLDDTTAYFGGRITTFNPGCELSFENNWEDDLQWAVPTFITLRITGMYGGCLVELFHHGFERLGENAAAIYESYEQGWSSHHLVRLRAIVEQ